VPEIHRWRAVVDFYAYETPNATVEVMESMIQVMESMIRRQFTKWFPCGVVEGYPDVYDQDEKRAKIETPFGGGQA